ncbi:nitroreductase family protein [Abyssalbus ytuae]|uniref:Nitroreductase family protein n=1 Tax=Abyssalbus ytuae TaxID=2926907 RepID=A0A9E6ZYL1_9FLAO|nr:nitroreductase family protein [Abyssalbus ytuae]UOB17587.1 nitroreductase family protein [Abyssalbus ytuae]
MEKNNIIIKKETPTDYNIIPLLKERWSPRVFSDLPISEADLHTLFEAGRWAASSNNLQPWRIIWGVKGSKAYDRLLNCLDDFNQSWAKNAPVLLATMFKKTLPSGKENFHALHDLGLFMGNLTAQAQHMGIAVHHMAGINYKKAAEEFNIPDDFHVTTGVALGYYGGNPEVLPDDLKKMETQPERSRKPQEEFIFNGNFTDRAKI